MKIGVLLLLVFTLGFSRNLLLGVSKDTVAHTVSQRILEKAYPQIGIEPKFIYLQLEESLKRSNSGELDGDVSRMKTITEHYPNLVQVPVVITYVEAVAFSNKNMKIEKWKDLESHKFTIIKGAKFIEYATKDMNKTILFNMKIAFGNLYSGKTDVVVVLKKSGLIMIRELGYKDVKIISPILQRLDLYHFLHKKNIDLVEKIRPILQKMQDSGELKYIHDTYHRYQKK